MSKSKTPDVLDDEALQDVIGGGYPNLVMKRGVVGSGESQSRVLLFDEADSLVGKRSGVVFEPNDEP
jgi:hypothetical protein